jgi:hypothetical protein
MPSTPIPCYPANVMYQDNVVLLIEQVETNLAISIPSLRTNSPGITFPNTQQPTLLVHLNSTLASRIISISVPNQNNKTNVNQIELVFYDINNVVLQNSVGEKWIVETTPGVTKVCFIVYNARRKNVIFILA